MGISRSTIAAVRFGYGLDPGGQGPAGADALLAQLRGPDQGAERFPIDGLAQRGTDIVQFIQLRKAAKRDPDTGRDPYRRHRREMRQQLLGDVKAEIARAAFGSQGFRERLARFWADHFTVEARGAPMRFTIAAFGEDAIRPNLTARFADMLKAVVVHPAMLMYLDQASSFGPNSRAGRRRNKGLNENLAREVLELHTLGVGGTYTQDDVRQFAELLTGLTYLPQRGGFHFLPNMAEPGAEVLLGRSYGGGKPGIADIFAALDDLAVMPDTARHIARKLAVHFVADDPDPGLVAAMEAAFLDTGGDLGAVCAAMLGHPAAWAAEFAKARQPFDFVAASLRSLQVTPQRLNDMNAKQFQALILGPLQAMGQPMHEPGGPDGWKEGFADWISPQGMGARISWAMSAPRFLTDPPDPRTFAHAALGETLRRDTSFVVDRAESRWEGVGLVLAAPEFHRR